MKFYVEQITDKPNFLKLGESNDQGAANIFNLVDILYYSAYYRWD